MNEKAGKLEESLAFLKLSFDSPEQEEKLTAFLEVTVDRLTACGQYEAFLQSLRTASTRSQEKTRLINLPQAFYLRTVPTYRT